MAITLFGVTSTPTDNGSQAGPTVTITPPSSMTVGMLVVVFCHYRGGSQTFTNNVAGGQTWNAETNYNATNNSSRLFWCRFDGTWTANPQFTVTTGTNPHTVVMMAFSPTTSTNLWGVDVQEDIATPSAPSTPYTVSITGQTTSQNSTVSIAGWFNSTTRTWGSIAGTGWADAGGSQYRNLQGSTLTSTYAYKVQSSSGATGNVSKNEDTNQAAVTWIMTFYEYADNASVGVSGNPMEFNLLMI